MKAEILLLSSSMLVPSLQHKGIKVWDIQSRTFVADIKATPIDPIQIAEKSTAPIGCTSLAWNKSGNLLFAGFTDNYVRVFKIVVTN
jgi:hypothetical protein